MTYSVVRIAVGRGLEGAAPTAPAQRSRAPPQAGDLWALVA